MELGAQEGPPHATLLGCSFQNLLLGFSLTDGTPMVCWARRGGQSNHGSPPPVAPTQLGFQKRAPKS